MLRIVTIAGDGTLEAQVARDLDRSKEVDLHFRCVDRIEMLAALRSDPLDAFVIVGSPGWLDLELIDQARAQDVFCLGVATNDMDLALLRNLGVPVCAPDPSDLLAAIRRRGDAPAPPPRMPIGSQRGRLVAVWGPKGAPGRSTLAIELATQLAAHRSDTLLIDADPYGGDIAQMVGLVEEPATVVWASKLAGKGELDAARLGIELRRVGKTGPAVLAGLTRAELWPEVTVPAWRRVLQAVLSEFGHAIADVGGCLEPSVAVLSGEDGRNRMARTTLEAADQVVAVFRADPVGIRHLLWDTPDLFDLVDRDRVLFVANHLRRGAEREVAALLRQHLGVRPSAYVPFDPADHHRALMTGRSLGEVAPGCDGVAAIKGLANAVGSSSRPRGVLSRLAGR